MAMAYLLRVPSYPQLLRNLGEGFLDYALELQPGAPDAHLLKAWYLYDRKEIQQAVVSAERALAVDSNYAKAWLGSGYFLMELNQFPEAVASFQRGLELYPGCPQRQSVRQLIANIEQISFLSTAQNH